MPTGNNDFYQNSASYLSGVAAPVVPIVPQSSSSVPSSSALESVDMGIGYQQHHRVQQQQQQTIFQQQSTDHLQHQDPYASMHSNPYQLQNAACAYSNEDYGNTAAGDLSALSSTRRRRHYNMEITQQPPHQQQQLQQQPNYESDCQQTMRNNRTIQKRLDNNVTLPIAAVGGSGSDAEPSSKFVSSMSSMKITTSNQQHRRGSRADSDDDGDDLGNSKKQCIDDDDNDEKSYNIADNGSEPGPSGSQLPEYAWMKRVHSNSGKLMFQNQNVCAFWNSINLMFHIRLRFYLKTLATAKCHLVSHHFHVTSYQFYFQRHVPTYN